MVKVQVDIDKNAELNLRFYMAYNDMKSKSEAINIIINEYFVLKNSHRVKKMN